MSSIRTLAWLIVAALAIAPLPRGSTAEPPAIGFFGDGTGYYPHADPPVRWGPEENVVWKADMPSWSNAQPVGSDGRIYALSEPIDTGPILLCIDDANGAVLWQREIDYLDPETERAFAAYMQELWATQRQINLTTDKAERKKLKWPRLPPALKERGVRLPEWGLGTTTGWEWQWTGYAFASPVTDGNRIWTWTYPGIATCFDRDGAQLWQQVFHPQEGKEPFGNSVRTNITYTCSPLLAREVLVVLGGNLVRGLDAATGAVRWRHHLKRLQRYEETPPKLVTVADTAAAFCIDGSVYRLQDGHELFDFKLESHGNSTMARGDTVYFSRAIGKKESVTCARRLVAVDADTWTATPLWQADGALDRCHGWHRPVLGATRIYGEGGAYDLATGECSRTRFRAGKAGPIIVGDRIVIPHRKRPKRFDGPEGGSYIAVHKLESGRLLAINVLPLAPLEGAKRDAVLARTKGAWSPNGCQIVFCMGDRLYVRTHDHLWCIGR